MATRGRILRIKAYSPMVGRQDNPSATQNPIPCRSITGKDRNIGSEGTLNQKVASAWPGVRSTSAVSR
jgi:hypothetical protein